jgi:hypothetical protein
VTASAGDSGGSDQGDASGGVDTGTSAGTGNVSADTGADGSSLDGGSAGSSDTGVNDPGDPSDCDGTTYACGDGIDNDEDGNVDLADGECTGPCDDDEASFQTGIPGDNMDCKQDCFFDGNSGSGNDGCTWDLKCDPENPGEFINCEFTDGNNCDDMFQTPECIDYCAGLTPPGCDCFGCCTVDTPDGPVNIFLNGSPDCSLDNLDACTPCTPSTDCGNDCNPDDCELCFGEEELPPGCEMAECSGNDPCDTNADCPTDYYCYLGCCYPPPPG